MKFLALNQIVGCTSIFSILLLSYWIMGVSFICSFWTNQGTKTIRELSRNKETRLRLLHFSIYVRLSYRIPENTLTLSFSN